MSTPVFFSHTSRDAAWCERLASEAAEFGFAPYMAEHDVQAGTHLSDKVTQAIERSEAVFVLLTDNTANSAYVHQEIGYARARKKLVIPLVQPDQVQAQLGMLTGIEYVEFDFRNPEADREGFRLALKAFLAKRSQQELINVALVLGIIAVLILVLPES